MPPILLEIVGLSEVYPSVRPYTQRINVLWSALVAILHEDFKRPNAWRKIPLKRPFEILRFSRRPNARAYRSLWLWPWVFALGHGLGICLSVVVRDRPSGRECGHGMPRQKDWVPKLHG